MIAEQESAPSEQSAAGAPEQGSRSDIFVVCRANRGRSPLVAHLLRQQAEARGIAARIHDAGLYVDDRHLPLTRLDPLVAPWGLDLSRHQPTSIRFDRPGDVRIVITFEEQLKRDLVQLVPPLVDRVFTLRELVRLSSSPAWRERSAGGSDLVRRLHLIRPLVDPGTDDTTDPARVRSRRGLRRLVAELAYDTSRISDLLWGPSSSGGSSESSGV